MINRKIFCKSGPRRKGAWWYTTPIEYQIKKIIKDKTCTHCWNLALRQQSEQVCVEPASSAVSRTLPAFAAERRCPRTAASQLADVAAVAYISQEPTRPNTIEFYLHVFNVPNNYIVRLFTQLSPCLAVCSPAYLKQHTSKLQIEFFVHDQ